MSENIDMKSKSQVIACENCGASFSIHEEACPFCGYINQYGAEEKYMEHMQEIKANLAEVDDEQIEIAKKEAKKSGKIILWVIIIVLIITGILYALFKISATVSSVNTMSDTEVAMWLQEHQKDLDAMYDAKDYEGLMDYYDQIMEDNNIGGFYSWPHGYMVSSIANIRFFTNFMDNYELKDSDYEYLLFEATYYYKREHEKTTLSSKDIAIVDEYAGPYIDKICKCMDIDESVLDDICETCTSEYGSLVTTKVSKYYKEHIKK